MENSWIYTSDTIKYLPLGLYRNINIAYFECFSWGKTRITTQGTGPNFYEQYDSPAPWSYPVLIFCSSKPLNRVVDGCVSSPPCIREEKIYPETQHNSPSQFLIQEVQGESDGVIKVLSCKLIISKIIFSYLRDRTFPRY